MTELTRATIQTIVIIDTHPISRQGLSTLLQEEFPQATIAEAKTITEFHQTGLGLASGLFIMVINSDFEEEGHNPVTELIKLYPQAHIILYGEELKAEVTIDYLKCGVKGYILNHKNLTELVNCILAVAEGDSYLSTDHMKYLFGYLIENYKTSRKQDLLTPRQKEISKLLVQGLTTSGIAERTGLHISTISTFKTAIFAKLGIDNILKLKQILEVEDDNKPV
jgi:DNA-binding NarL/FixJ family response regulator